MSARRFCAQASSVSPTARGFSRPKLTASIREGSTPTTADALDGLAALLPERKVVFAAAAIVGVAFHRHMLRRIGHQVAGVGFHDRHKFGLNSVAVEIKVDGITVERRTGSRAMLGWRHRPGSCQLWPIRLTARSSSQPTTC